MSKGAYLRKTKRIARMKDQDRAGRWRERVEREFGGAETGVLARGADLVQGALSSVGRVVRGVGSALLGAKERASQDD